MEGEILGHGEFRLNSKRPILHRAMAAFFLFLFVAPHAYAQAGPLILRAGKWIGDQLIGYGTGKAIDLLLGQDYEKELQQVEASLSLQLRKERSDKEKIRTELAATKSQLQILDSLLRSRPKPVDVEGFRGQLAKDLENVLRVQGQHDERITRLEREIEALTLRLRRLEAGPTLAGRNVYKRVVDPKIALESAGINILKGQALNIKASGQVVTWHIENASGPDGQRFACNSECKCTFPEGRFGQLIGRIGESGQVFGVGSSYTSTAAEEGVLFLGANDCNDWSNNTGSYNVTIETTTNPVSR